jgi:hypothetical protein
MLDPFREMASAMRSRTGFDGTMLKFTKGRWTAGKSATDMGDKELIAHVDQLMYGWTKWEDKKPVDYDVGFVRDRYRPPPRRQLGDDDPDKWERERDPWQRSYFLPLTDPTNGDFYVWSTASDGGKEALADLQDAYADNRELHPKDAHQLPVICLSGDHYNHPDHGRVETPLLDIVRWVDPPKNIKQIRPPKTASSTLVIEQKRDEASDKGFGSDFGADFDDEFPLSE